MSNMWNSQQNDTNQTIGNNASPRAGNLLREYRHQHNSQPQSPPQYSPVAPTAQNQPGYDPYSPPMTPQQNGYPANAWARVKQLSGKVVAAHRAGYEPPLPPMEMYRPQPRQNSQPLPQPLVKPWRRSRTLRLAKQRRQRRQVTPTGKRIGIGILIAFTCLMVILVSSGGAYAYSYYQSQLPRLQGLADQQISQTTHIYDRNGTLLYDAYDQGMGGGRRTYVDYSHIPWVMDEAMTAAEDPTFWDNAGIDPQGITRAFIELASSGHIQSGGSTLTQQLIKNLTGNAQDTFQRKISEAALSVGLTQQLESELTQKAGKEKILEMYLNVAPFGSQDLGVEAAAQEYFGLQPQCTKDFMQGTFNCATPAIAQLYYNPQTKLKDDYALALARASLLAGLPQSPVSYDPVLGTYNRQLSLQRQDYVLNQMMKDGMSLPQSLNANAPSLPITPALIKQAEALTAKMTFTSYQHNELAPHFVNWVIQQMEIGLGNGNQADGVNAFLTGGFNVRTSIDANIEQYVENAVTRHLFQPEYQPFLGDYGPLNVVHKVNDAAVVVMNAKTGEIIAMDGSAAYDQIKVPQPDGTTTTINPNDPLIDGQFNVATDGYGRQPGSTFKIFDYVTGFEMGWYPGIVLPDVKTYFPNGSGSPSIANAYVPFDYGQTYSGSPNPILDATANSRNVPAVKTVEFTGMDNVINTARRFGVTAIDTETAAYNTVHKTHLTPAQYFGPSIALGTAQIPLLQMTGAYQVLANQGTRVPPHSILDIWDNYGHHLYHYDTAHPNGTSVVTPQIAYLMTSVLMNEPARYPEFLNDHILSLWDMDPTHTYQVAAKTGTTDNFVDNLTLGYTPDFVVGVWTGNANNAPMINSIGLTGAAPIWHSVVENLLGQCNYDATTSNAPDSIQCNDMQDVKALGFNPHPIFPVPTGVVQAPTSSYNGLMGNGYDYYMLDGEQPMQSGFVQTTPTNNGGNNGGH